MEGTDPDTCGARRARASRGPFCRQQSSKVLVAAAAAATLDLRTDARRVRRAARTKRRVGASPALGREGRAGRVRTLVAAAAEGFFADSAIRAALEEKNVRAYRWRGIPGGGGVEVEARFRSLRDRMGVARPAGEKATKCGTKSGQSRRQDPVYVRSAFSLPK